MFNAYLSRDGSSPAEFLTICRQQLERYDTVQIREATVTSVEREQSGFAAALSTGEQLRSRMLLLATGLVDELPAIEGAEDFYGDSAQQCPFCHGWEHRGEPIAVIGNEDPAAELALELLIWSKDVVLCSNGALRCAPGLREKLARKNIQVIETPVRVMEGKDRKLCGLRLLDGAFLPRKAAYFSLRQSSPSSIAKTLGCECGEDGATPCGDDGRTQIPGLYIAGNASPGPQLAIFAAAKGAMAAVAINNALLETTEEMESPR